MNNSAKEINVPARYIEDVVLMSNGISFPKEQQLSFIKSCLFYLQEGIKSEQAINMALVDYLIES